jgi:hypothetical protein
VISRKLEREQDTTMDPTNPSLMQFGRRLAELCLSGTACDHTSALIDQIAAEVFLPEEDRVFLVRDFRCGCALWAAIRQKTYEYVKL